MTQVGSNGDRWFVADTDPPRVVLETTPEAEHDRQHPPVSEEAVLDVQRHQMPEGAGPAANERRVVPWVVGGLAVIGLVVVGSVIGLSEGWRAGLVAVVLVLLAYCVSWIVVWGAGVMRAKDEAVAAGEVEELFIEDPLQDPPFDSPPYRP
jgi:hypothetical protein